MITAKHKNQARFNFFIPNDLLEKLRQLAYSQDLTISQFLRRLISREVK